MLRGILCIVLVFEVSFSALAQPSNIPLKASLVGEARLEVVKNSIHPDSWPEKPFWKLYENYAAKKEEASLTYTAISELAKTDNSVSVQTALENGRRALAFRFEEVAVWKQYFAEVSSAHNGIIALQFLQTEVLLDIMESSNIYEGTPNRNFNFHPNAIATSQVKYETIARALALASNDALEFLTLYKKYEGECIEILGENYNLFEMYGGDPTDYTQLLAKTLGNNLLMVMKREIKLKEKYFELMNEAMGPSLAARFLAWEDYCSVISRMHAWKD